MATRRRLMAMGCNPALPDYRRQALGDAPMTERIHVTIQWNKMLGAEALHDVQDVHTAQSTMTPVISETLLQPRCILLPVVRRELHSKNDDGHTGEINRMSIDDLQKILPLSRVVTVASACA